MKVIIDRFEGDFAIVELDKSFINMPKILLPKLAQEGDVIEITINEKETANRKERIKALMNEVWEE